MDYNLTKKDVEKLLNKSSKTISRYIKKGLLHPIKKKVDGYITYLFALEDIEGFTRGQSGHEGQTTRGQGTNGGTFRTTEQDRNIDRVNKLHGGTEETNEGTKQGKKHTPQDIGDRTRDTETLDILKETIAILKEQLDQKDKQITNITNTMQFALKEASEYRQMLALPNPTSEAKQGATGDILEETEDRTPVKEGTKDRTQDKTPETEETKTTGHTVKKVVSKAKQNRGQRGQKSKAKPKKQPITSGKTEVKVEPKKNKKRFNFFKWITS